MPIVSEESLLSQCILVDKGFLAMVRITTEP